MRRRFRETVERSTELRALFVLGVVLILRAWRSIPYLRPTQLLVPATLMQIVIFVTAAIKEKDFLLNLAIGNLIVVGLALMPMTLAKPKPTMDKASFEN